MKFTRITAEPPARLGRRVELMALDRSMRSYDEDGRLRVRATNISKAAVNPYIGRSIPDSDRLGLDPDRVYMLFRDPAELARAAPTFNSVPLLNRHVAVHAGDHRPDLVVGSTGTDCLFVPPYLQVSLVIWSAAGISLVESGEQKQLSAAYRYDCDLSPGSYNGVPFDGVMRNIRGSHVALVEEGRAGPDVVVGDAALKTKGKFMARDGDSEIDPGIRSQLLSYLGELLPKDQLDDVEAILNGQTVAAPSMAADARQVARRVVAAHRARQDRAFLERFPGADRLRG